MCSSVCCWVAPEPFRHKFFFFANSSFSRDVSLSSNVFGGFLGSEQIPEAWQPFAMNSYNLVKYSEEIDEGSSKQRRDVQTQAR